MDQRTPRIALLTLLTALSASAATTTPTSLIARLPNVQIKAAKVDASGNIYVAGTMAVSGTSTAYVARLNPDGTPTMTATFAAAGTIVTALDIDSAGNAYIAGTTPADASSGSTAFAAKVDFSSHTSYSVPIGGNTTTQPSSVAVNSKGELIVSGQQTVGAPTEAVLSLFVLKLSADGTKVTSGPQGIGGLVTVDAQDNVYVVGVPPGSTDGPAATPGAFQGTPITYFCGCPLLNFACGGNQFVASLSSDLSRTRFVTYVAAKYGAAPSYIGLDSQGNILIAGTTAAPAYPTTPASYMPKYTAASKIVLTCGPPIPMEVTSPSGYVTLLKSDGSGLVFSTFFSGSKTDSVTFASLTSNGIYLGGQASSVDLPGFDGAVPSPCVPVGFVSRMTLDGTAVSSTHTPPGIPLAYDSTTATLLLASGSDLLRFDPSQPTSIACIVDSADLTPVTTVAPGELLTMFGRFLYLQTQTFFAGITTANGQYPVTSQGVGITANQTPAPLLYLSAPQINFQVPYEIAGSPRANFLLSYADVNGNTVSDSRTINVSASNPVAFLSQPSIVNQSFPLALNADGTANSQSNPAPAGSLVTIFLDGLGVTSPTPVTGAVNASKPVPLNVALTVTSYCDGALCYTPPTIASAGSLPGSISGVTQVQLVAPANTRPGFAFLSIFSLSAGTVPVRDAHLSFWVK